MTQKTLPKAIKSRKGSFEAALERNKIEVKILNTNKEYLDRLQHQNIAKIEREELNLNQQYIYMLKKQEAVREDEMKLEGRYKKRPPSRYFEMINLNKVDKSNSLLPSLVKSLNEQRVNSYRTLADIRARERIKLVKKNANNNLKYEDTLSRNSDMTATSFSNFSVDSLFLPNLSINKAKNAKIVDERPKSSIYDINRFDLNSCRSIRRERLSARKMNESYVSKSNMLKISKRFEVDNSACSKNCKFKHF